MKNTITTIWFGIALLTTSFSFNAYAESEACKQCKANCNQNMIATGTSQGMALCIAQCNCPAS